MSKYHDDSYQASEPGLVPLSLDKLRVLAPRLDEQSTEIVAEHLMLGDSRAACVVSLQPLIVAAYTSEIDCVVFLWFPQRFVEEYELEVGSRLLTVNTYDTTGRESSELTPGPGSYGEFDSVYPMIADFLTEDAQRLEVRKLEIVNTEWERCMELGSRYDGRFVRIGSPALSWRPGVSVKNLLRSDRFVDRILLWATPAVSEPCSCCAATQRTVSVV